MSASNVSERYNIGDLVCVHDSQSDEWGDFPATWIGQIAGNETAGSDLYLVRHRPGRSQLSKCECEPRELRRVITTFEGPMCTVCPPPKRKR